MNFELFVGFVLVLHCISQCSGEEDPPNYAINPITARQLFFVEESLADLLSATKINNASCRSGIQNYLSKFQQSKAAFPKSFTPEQRAETVVGNGLLIFKMIYRLFKFQKGAPYFKECYQESDKQQEISVWDKIQNEFDKVKLSMPTREDLRDALLGLIRIQYVYGFNASDLQIGKFGDMQTEAMLDFVDCYDIGTFALGYRAFALAYQWFHTAQQLAEDYYQFELLDDIWKQLAEAANVKVSDLGKEFAGKIEQSLEDGMANYSVYAPCRGEDANSKGRCYYSNRPANPYFWIGPLKIEILSEDPLLIQYHDFVGDTTIAFLKKSATQDVYRYNVETEESDAPAYGDFLTAMNMEVKDEDFDGETKSEIIKRLDAKMELASGFVVNSSDVHVLMYGPFGHYDIHHDSLAGSAAYEAYVKDERGDRAAQFFIYLSDVAIGGYTAFTNMQVHAKPLKGSALFWFNYRRNGSVDLRRMHCGCPIILGTKQVIRIEVNQLDNIFTLPCDLDRLK